MGRPVLVLFLLIVAFMPLVAQQDSHQNGEELFNRGTSLYQRSDFRRAYDTLIQSIEAYDQAGQDSRVGIMNARLWAGAAAYHLERYDDAETQYVASFALAEELGDTTFGANVATALANLKNSLADYDEAADWYIRAGEFLRELGNPTQAQQSIEYGGYVLTLAGRYDDAFALFEAAVLRASRRPASERAWLHSMRGNAHYYLDRFPEALGDYREAAELYERSGAQLELSQAFGWIGKILFDTGENDAALDYFGRSLSLARQMRSREDESRVLAYFGFLYASIGDYAQGTDYYEQSLRIAKSLGIVEFIIAAYDSLAWIYEQAGEDAKALDATASLVASYRQTTDAENLALALNDLGLLHYYADDYGMAIAAYEEALTLQQQLGNRQDEAIIKLNLGVALEEVGRAAEAGAMVEESLSISLELGELTDAEDSIGFLGYLYGEAYDYQKLIDVLARFVPVYEDGGQTTELMHVLNNLGTFYFALDDYHTAIDHYRDARELAQELGMRREQAIHGHNIGQSQAALAQFDRALTSFESALQIATTSDTVDVRASIFNSLGELYRAWGWFERSLEYFREAQALFESVGDLDGLASVSNNTGQSIRQGGDPEGSLEYYLRALEMNDELDDAEARAIYLSNIGEAHRQSGDLETAKEFYGKALAIDNEIRNLRGINIRKNNLGLVLMLSGSAREAIPYFVEGLEYWRSVGDKREEAFALTNLGDAYFDTGQYRRSAEYLEEAVAIQEELRVTAVGSVRRDYLQNQIFVYRSLARSYLFDGQVWRSLYALELSKAKYLLEQMGDPLEGVSFDFATFLEFQRELGSRSALLSVARLDEASMQVVLLTDKQLASTAVYMDYEQIDELYDRYSRQIIRQTQDPGGDHFAGLVIYYRSLLSRPFLSVTDTEAIGEIGRYLYSITLGAMEEQLARIESLIIVPDGELGVVPFETFQGPDDRYVIERFDVSYAQSLVVALESIKRTHPSSREPLLAFGGAIYDESADPAASGSVASAADLEGIRSEVSLMIAGRSSTRGAYARMGIDTWQNLPGTLDEVRLLGEIVAGAQVHTGSEVSESFVKELSFSGSLSNYEVLHFATHGIVVPEVPELSAVVLSQTADDTGDEDGYLTMSEIAELELAADFVNLSACETGLGKVYLGEGVVGLTQSFLIAGANSLSVSLWQVADESTRSFMTGLYTLVEEDGFTYAEAMSEMKRGFLDDDRYRNPFYWAPYVFYGDFGAGQ